MGYDDEIDKKIAFVTSVSLSGITMATSNILFFLLSFF